MQNSLKLSFDWWSVLWAIGAVTSIKIGILPHIHW